MSPSSGPRREKGKKCSYKLQIVTKKPFSGPQIVYLCAADPRWKSWPYKTRFVTRPSPPAPCRNTHLKHFIHTPTLETEAIHACVSGINSWAYIGTKNILSEAVERMNTHCTPNKRLPQISFNDAISAAQILKTRIRLKMNLNDEQVIIWQQEVLDSGAARFWRAITVAQLGFGEQSQWRS